MTCLGIDVGGTSVKMAMIEANHTLWTGKSPSYSRPTTDQLIDAIRAAADGRVHGAEAVGICVPGLMDKSTSTVTLSVNVPGLVGVPLHELVARSLGNGLGKVWPASDAVAAAYDIWLTRNLQGRLLVLALGTGIGAAVLDGGIPLKVDGDSPGHLGQIDVSVEGSPVIGPDGSAGSLEGYLGLPALRKKYGEHVAAAVNKLTGEEPELKALARAVRIAHAIYCPQHIVLAGGIGTRLNHVLKKLRELIEVNLTRIAKPGWTLSVADHDFHSAVGAAKLASTR